MTKRNIIALCGLLAASGLQAGEIPRLHGEALSKALEQIRQGTYGAATRVAPIASQGAAGKNIIGQAAQQGWKDYLTQQASNFAGAAGSKLSSWGNNIGYGWNRWKESSTGSIPTYLGRFGTGLAGYAANPYLAQGIANRLPSASFIKDYPTATNAAALAAAAGAGALLYKGCKAAMNWYRGPLNYQIENLIEQFNQTQDETKKKSIENQILALSKQNAEIILSQNPTLTLLEKALRAIEGYIAFAKLVPAEKETNNPLSSQFYDFQTKGFGAVAQTLINTIEHSNQFHLPGENNQEQHNYIEALLNIFSRQEIELETLQNTSTDAILRKRIEILRKNFLPVIGEKLLVLKGTIEQSALQSWKNQEIKQNLQPLSLEQQIEQAVLAKQRAENEFYHRFAKKGLPNLTDQEAIAAATLREKIDKLDAQYNNLLAQQQNAGWFGWLRRR